MRWVNMNIVRNAKGKTLIFSVFDVKKQKISLDTNYRKKIQGSIYRIGKNL
jgi:hypothetical protein